MPNATARNAKSARNTFDVALPPNRAPRVPYHEAHLRAHQHAPLPDALWQALPLEAFAAVELSARGAGPARHRYFTHDNGGRPYLVRVDPARRRATIRRNRAPGVASADGEGFVVTYDQLVRRVEYTRFWNGYAPFNNSVALEHAIGNTLLFETLRAGRRRYLLVAGQVYAFELPEGHPPLEFMSSPLGNNDVPYPYGWSERYAYLLLPDPRIEFTETSNVAAWVKSGDLASLFYGHRDWQSGAFTFDFTKRQRAALRPLPRSSFAARAVHTRNAELEAVR